MTPTKLLIRQILVVLAIILAGIWTATQWAAASLAYQPELGRPWFAVLGMPVYPPWSLFPWWFSFDAYAPVIFDEAGAIAAGSGLLGCAAAVFGSIWRARQSSNVTTYGSARWATRRDIAAAGLLENKGVALGRIGSQYLRHDGPEHVMAFAPTRSGKGVGLVVPTRPLLCPPRKLLRLPGRVHERSSSHLQAIPAAISIPARWWRRYRRTVCSPAASSRQA